MDVTVGLFLLILAAAFVCEYIDASLGMGYGTILTPVLLLAGFQATTVVPAVLLSQAVGGLTASVFHHRAANVEFSRHSKDTRIVLVITGFGLLATVVAALIAIRLPKPVLDSYIGLLVTTMGALVLRNRPFTFSWRRMVGVGVLSAFNKGLSGGGFGPVVTAGQILSGQGHRAAVGVTTLAEAPICLAGWLTYMIGRSVREIDGSVMDLPLATFLQRLFAPDLFQWELVLALLLGAVFVAPFAALTTRWLGNRKMHLVIGLLILALGIATLIRTWL